MVKNVASNAITFLIVLMLAVLGLIAWGASEMRSPGSSAQDTVFEVKSGDRLTAVSARLAAAGLISNARIFRIAARYGGQAKKLKFGEYKVPAHASMNQVLALVTSGRALAYQVTIPEGMTSWQIVERLKAQDRLTGKVDKVPPEGSLAPNTYSYSKGASRVSLLQRMSLAQSKILATAWASRADGLPLKTPEEALTLASIIEKETGEVSERAVVASVFINRLRRGMRLQTDPTVIYGVTKGRGKLGRGLRQSELRGKTAWNTYVIPGLPKTPIANPGKGSITAALHPADTKFLFFVADGTGGHAFSQTIGEHNKNVRKWRRIEAKQRAKKAKAKSD